MIKTPKKHHPSPLCAYGITLQNFLRNPGLLLLAMGVAIVPVIQHHIVHTQ